MSRVYQYVHGGRAHTQTHTGMPLKYTSPAMPANTCPQTFWFFCADEEDGGRVRGRVQSWQQCYGVRACVRSSVAWAKASQSRTSAMGMPSPKSWRERGRDRRAHDRAHVTNAYTCGHTSATYPGGERGGGGPDERDRGQRAQGRLHHAMHTTRLAFDKQRECPRCLPYLQVL